jgi:hypothetical protein
MVAQGQQGGYGPGGLGWHVVAAGAAVAGGDFFAAQLADVVGGLAGGVAVLPGHRLHLGGELGDGEPAGRWPY